MNRNGWGLWDDRGFLIIPDPQTLHQATDFLSVEVIEQLESLGTQLPDLVEGRNVRHALQKLPQYDMASLHHAPASYIARAFQLYSYFASAYVHMPDGDPVHILPAQIAVPLVQLSERIARPPIMAYADYTLANWVRLDADAPIVADNLRLLQYFTHVPDAEWFTLIHVEIEAHAARAITATLNANVAIAQDDPPQLIAIFETIATTLDTMMATLQRMPEKCHPQVYYHQVRPYMFGFDKLIYEGVVEYGGKPQHFRGETGAQSSIIPLLVQFMGVQHEQTSLTQHLRIMRDYMPQEHRKALTRMDNTQVRQYVSHKGDNKPLQDAYNHTLQRLSAFRQLHLRFAASYIANQAPTSTGTGGTDFMSWLQQLIDETDRQYVG